MKRVLLMTLLAVAACKAAPSVEQEARIPGLAALTGTARGTALTRLDSGRYRADRADALARITVGGRYADGFSVARSEDAEASLTLQPLHADGVLEARADGVARYGLARAHAEALIATGPDLAEEIVLIEDAAGPQELSYRVLAGTKVQKTRLNGGQLEAVSADGQVLLRSPQPRILDAAGRNIAGDYTLSGDLLTVRWPKEGLTYPIAVDPAVTSSTGPVLALMAGATTNVTTGAHDFGSLPKQSLGSTASISSPAIFTVISAGSSSVTLNSITASNTTNFTVQGLKVGANSVSLPQVLAPGTSLTFQVTFSAPNSATVGTQVSSNITFGVASGSTPTLSVTGTPVAAIPSSPSAFPSTLTFDQTAVGSSRVLYVDIYPLTGTSSNTFTCQSAPAITGTGSAHFSVDTSCSAGSSFSNYIMRIPVTYTPTAAGAESATLTFAGKIPTDGSYTTYTINLTGTGIQSNLNASGALAFGNVRKGSSNNSSPLLSNSGTAYDYGTVTVSGVYAADFALVPANSLAVIPPRVSGVDGSWTWPVKFTPSTTGLETATLTYTSSTGATKTFVMTGTGVFPNIVQPISINAGNVRKGTTVSMPPISFANTGTDVLNISNGTMTGSFGNASDFKLPNSAPLAIAAGSTATLTPTFTPTSLGQETAQAVYSAGDFGTVTVLMSGTSIFPLAAVSPSSLDMGGVRVGSTSDVRGILIQNNGNDVLNIDSVSFSGNTGDYAFSGSLPTTVAAGTSVGFTFTFTPSGAGSRPTTAVFAAGDYGNISVSLSGEGTTPQAALTTATLAYGNQRVGTTASKSVAISNNGTDTLTISGYTITGAGAADYSVSPVSGSQSLSVGASAAYLVSFTPSVGASRVATLSFQTDAGTKTVALTGAGVSPQAAYSVTSLDFGSIRKGNSSASKTVTLTNNGNDVLNVTGFFVSGTNASDFLASHSAAPFTVPGAGGTTSWGVTFLPSKTGAESATLSIFTDVGQQDIALTGTGTFPTLALSTTNLDFAPQSVGTTSTGLTFTVTNTGTDAAQISSKTVGGAHSGDFTLTGPASISAGSSGVFTVKFAPTIVGTVSAPLTIVTDAGTLTAFATGIGVAPAIAVSTPSLTFPNQVRGTTSAVQTVTITNIGGADLSVTNAVMAGTNSSDFVIQSPPSFPATVAAGSTISFGVAFTPTTTSGETASLDVFFGGNISQVSISLSGTGIGAVATIFPSTVAFGSFRVGNSSTAQGVQLTNSSSEAIKVTGYSVTGASLGVFTVSPASSTVTIQPGQSATWLATFSPVTTGAASAALNFATDHGGFGATLSGTGTFPTTVVNATVLDLGTTPKGTTSAPKSFTVTNAGTDSLTVSGFSIVGPDAADFVLASTSPIVVAAGATSSPITVRLTPSHTGIESATLGFSTDNGAETVGLTGLGIAPNVVASRTTMDFGGLQLAEVSAPQTVVLANTGTNTATISASITGPQRGEFTLSGPASVTLAAGQTVSWNVVYGPSVTGTATATLGFQTDSGTLNVALTGVGGDIRPTATFTCDAGKPDCIPDTLNFNPMRVGATQATQTLIISNTGTSELLVSGYTVTGTGAGAFAVTPGSGAKFIPVGTSFAWTVSYVPAAAGPSAANISFTTDGGNLTGSLNGSAQFPTTTLSVNSLDYGGVEVNSTTPSIKTVDISNTGSASLGVSSVTKTGTNAADFIVTATAAPFSIGTGSSSRVSVQFKPGTVGVKTASLLIVTDNGTQNVSLIGVGMAPTASVSVASLAFGNQRRGVSSTPQVVTLTNTGSAPLHLSAARISGTSAADFSASPALAGATIAVGASTSWSISFLPSALGSAEASLQLESDGGNKTVALTGTGVAPSVSVTPPALSYTAQARGSASDPQQIIVTNNGTDALTVNGFVLSGANPADFIVSPTSQGLTIPAGGTSRWTVVFAPATGSGESATWTLNTELGASSVALTGVGISAPLTVSPTIATLADTRVFATSAPMIFTISNISSQPYAVRSFTFVGDNASEFSVLNAPTLPRSLDPGTNVTVSVVFTPTAAGPRKATFAMGTGDIATTLQVPLTGSGISSVATVNPVAVDFEQVVVGVRSTQPMQITNTGSDSLVVQSIDFGSASGPFGISDVPPLPLTVAPGLTINFTATYRPTVVGSAQSSITVTTDSPIGGSVEVPLSGEGIAPTISTTGTSLNFGTARVGSSAGVRVFTMTNTGTLVARVEDIRITGPGAADYAILSAPARPFTLAAGGGSATVAFGFTPSVHGSRAAVASIATNATSTAIQVSLSGTGLEPGVNASPTSLDFNVRVIDAPATILPVTLTNDGDAVLHLAAAVIDGSGAAAFSVQTPVEAVAVEAGQTITLPVSFKPASAGTFAGTLHLKSADSDGLAADITLAGVGVAPGLMVPGTVEFGLVSVKEKSAVKTVTLTNMNSADLVVTDLKSDSPEYVVTSDALPITIPGQSSVSATVQFSPLTDGDRIGHLQIYVEGRGSPLASVTLSGTGQALQTVKTGCASETAGQGALLMALVLLAVGRRRRVGVR